MHFQNLLIDSYDLFEFSDVMSSIDIAIPFPSSIPKIDLARSQYDFKTSLDSICYLFYFLHQYSQVRLAYSF